MNDPHYLLIRRALGGDEAALGQLCDHLGPVIAGSVARTLLRHGAGAQSRARQDAADFRQEVFLSLLERGGRPLLAWEPGRGASLASFVGLLAEHRVLSILRSRRHNPWHDDPRDPSLIETEQRTEESSPESVTGERLRLSQLVERLSTQLTPRARDMFERLYIAGQSPEQIGRTTGMSAASIYQWRRRLRSAARASATTRRTGTEPLHAVTPLHADARPLAATAHRRAYGSARPLSPPGSRCPSGGA